jgi:tRNA-dihydrouridine synthase
MQTPLRQIHVRNLQVNPPLLLAPMAGLTHSAFRQIISGFGGAGLLSTEMLSVKKLPNENSRVSPYLIRTNSEKPLSYQLLVSNAGEIARAIDALHALKADAVDLNMGCPAPTVRKLGAGICLMEQPEEVRRIVGEARKRTALPLSAKIRLGGELDERKLKAFCTMLEDEGIDMLSVHARLKKESFARRPRWECIAEIKDWLKVPVIARRKQRSSSRRILSRPCLSPRPWSTRISAASRFRSSSIIHSVRRSMALPISLRTRVSRHTSMRPTPSRIIRS